MRIVLKEKKKLKEVRTGKYGEIFVTMRPLTFLELTLPEPDFKYVLRFLDAAKGKPPEEMLKIARQMKSALDYEVAEIGADVASRGAFYFFRSKAFIPEMAERLSLAIEAKGGKIQVSSHGGRARSVIAELAGVPEIEASIMCYGFKWEDLDENAEIESQNFRGDPTSFIPKNKIKTQD